MSKKVKVKIYLKSGQIIEASFESISWSRSGSHLEKLSWSQKDIPVGYTLLEFLDLEEVVAITSENFKHDDPKIVV